jgi:M6 family metalloprotease-like protein
MSVVIGKTVVVRQEEGNPVELVATGDEFYVHLETRDGFTVCYDEGLGRYCYASVVDGKLVSTGATLDRRPPPGIARHLQESDEVQRQKFEQRYRRMRPSVLARRLDRYRTFGPNNGLLEGRRVSSGQVTGITVMVDFSDVQTAITRDQVNAMLNADNYSAYGNACSVNQYFHTVSNGKLNFRNIVIGPVRLPHTKYHYYRHSIVPEAMELAVEELRRQGVDFDQFDSKNKGIFDAISFLYAGDAVYGLDGDPQTPSDLWPHNSWENLRYNDMETHFYMLTNLGHHPVDLAIGTTCHENGHMLCRFPDLYDYGYRDGDRVRSRGMGTYCLMSAGNALNYERTPAPVSAYLRHLVGWHDRVVSLNGAAQHELRHGDYSTIFKYSTDRPNEYFLVENRSQHALDTHLPSGGLAIYHCDTLGSNEWQDGERTRHYQCALLQADGKLDLESNRPGDAADLYKDGQGAVLSDQTNPSSRTWSGADSGLRVYDVSPPGGVICFNVGQSQQPGIVADTAPNTAIPDDDQTGITSTIAIDDPGVLVKISVTVDIVHPYISDLQLLLRTPSNRQVTLHDRAGGDGDDIHQVYDRDSVAALGELEGESVSGDWALMVRDLAGRDIGRLKSWGLAIDTRQRQAAGEIAPAVPIPDDSPSGVNSSITITDEGQLRDVSIHVEIAHGYIGDLVLQLRSPSGQSVTLHNREGGGQGDLNATYDRNAVPALELLQGEAIRGDWTLHVRDVDHVIEGTLERWSLAIRY